MKTSALATTRAASNRAADSERPFIGRHHGLMDLFVPVVHLGEVREILADWIFLRAPPTSTEIAACTSAGAR